MSAKPGGGQPASTRLLSVLHGDGLWLRAALVFAGGPLLLLLLLTLHVVQGQMDLEAATVWQAIFRPDESLAHSVVRHVRLPRAAVGILAGAGLAVAGALFQTVTRNPMASTGTLGINAGAYLAVVAATIFAPGIVRAEPLLVALAGGLAAAVLVYVVAGGFQVAPVRMALAGVAVSLAIAAMTGALQLFFENEIAGLFLWGSGSLIQNDWSGVLYALPRLGLGLLAAIMLARSLDVMLLGDDVALSLGARVGWIRLGATLVGVWLASVTVSVVGPIGFVGLIVPHLIRLVGFQRHMALLPGAAVWGGVILLGADVVARMVRSSVTELPAGAVTALVGAPWLVWLAYRAGAAARGRVGGLGGGSGARARTAGTYLLLLAVAAAVLLAALAAGLALGGLRIELGQVWAVLTGAGADLHQNIIFNLRLPRMLVATTAGAALAVAGLLLQGVVRNPLADPSIVGVTSGAGLGAMLLLIAWPHLPVQLVPLAAFAGAFGAFALVYLLARRNGLQPIRLALVGIAVSAFCSALIQIFVVAANVRVAVALVWLTGSTYARGWSELLGLLAWPLILLPVAWVLARDLNLLALGDDVAAGLGLRVERSRLTITAIAVALAAAAVATVGTVGFVGLLAPHMARLLVGSDHRRLLPLAALLGAVLLTVADVLGRVVLAPREVPVGLVVALLGAPYFLWLMRRERAV